MIFLIIILSLFLRTAESLTKDNEYVRECSKPSKIEMPKLILPDLNTIQLGAKITIFPDTTKVILGTRSHYTSFCYDGGALDKNTGCYTKFENHLPTKEEIHYWNSKNECPIGPICRIDGHCWGSDSKLCLVTETNSWVKERKHTDIGLRYNLFAYHTCISSWACNTHLSELPLYTSIEDREIVQKTTLPNGTEILSKDLDGIRIKGSEDTIIWMYGEPKKPENVEANANCFYDEKNVICSASLASGDHVGHVYRIESKNFQGVYKNTVLTLTIKRDEADTKSLISYLRQQTAISNKLSQGFAATSLESLWETLQWTTFEIMDLKYNLMQSVITQHKILETLTKTIKSVSKIDDKLIGEIMDRRDIKTSWKNQEIFLLCKTNPPIIEDHETCHSGVSMQHGREMEDKNGFCPLFNLGEIKNLTLVLENKINFVETSQPELVAAHEDFEGWSWITEWGITNTEMFDSESKVDGSGESFVTQIISSFIPSSPLRWFSYACAWVSMLIHIVLCMYHRN